MEITILGTGADFPRPERPLTAVALRMDAELTLLDCGEGTQIAWAEQRLALGSLRRVVLTHLHPAQVLGLPGLLARRAQIQGAGPVDLVGPAGTEALLAPLLHGLGLRLPFALRAVELDGPAPGKKQPLPVAWEDDHGTMRWLPLDHEVPCLGLRYEEQPRPGRFDAQAARARGVTPGPDFGRLQAGQPVTAADGTVVQPHEVVGPARPGRVLAYVSDTAPCPALYRLLDGADLAILGGGWLPEHQAVATSLGQLGARDAARICARSRVRRALLAQLPPRLSDARLAEADALAAEHGEGYRTARVGERVVVEGRG